MAQGPAPAMPSPPPENSPWTPSRPEQPKQRPHARGFLGASLGHWTILCAALGFAIGVQVYVRHATTTARAAGSEVPQLIAEAPGTPVAAGDLWLRWEEVEGAEVYLLRITSATGDPIVDPMMEYGTVWNTPDELLPGFNRGTYFFQVEAQDAAGRLIARSLPAPVEILR